MTSGFALPRIGKPFWIAELRGGLFETEGSVSRKERGLGFG